MTDTYPWLTLVPPLLAILLAIVTRKVIPSLGVGVLAAALLIADFSPMGTLTSLWEAFAAIFWEDGELNRTYVFILAFTLLLGVIGAFIMMSGGTKAFADWAYERIHTRRGATYLPGALGMAIFVDDYFNALTVGQVSRPGLPWRGGHHIGRGGVHSGHGATSQGSGAMIRTASGNATMCG